MPHVDWVLTKDRLPDDDETVLVALSCGEVWTGYHDADDWRYVSADLMTEAPLYWAHFPAPPEAAP